MLWVKLRLLLDSNIKDLQLGSAVDVLGKVRATPYQTDACLCAADVSM